VGYLARIENPSAASSSSPILRRKVTLLMSSRSIISRFPE
jgi:hypothetical protein